MTFRDPATLELEDEKPSTMSPSLLADEAKLWSQVSGRFRQIGFSIVDQGFSVGGMFLVNIALARIQTKEEYGLFALTYSVFTFLAGIHTAAVLEAYTVHGSGRYHTRFAAYSWLLWCSNAVLCFALTLILVLAWRVLSWRTGTFASGTLMGMALACGFLLTASFVRRSFYMRRRADLAARFSLVFFSTCMVLLWLSIHTGKLTGFNAFAMAALSWVVAGLSVIRELPKGDDRSFVELEPGYWQEHWRYSRWVLITALVFQLTTQGYYWLAAGFLSVKDVGELRAMYNLVTPVDQIFVAMSFLILPMMSRRYTLSRMAGLVPLWKVYCGGSLVVTLCFAGLVNLLGRSAMHMLYAGKFDDIARYVGTLVLLPVIMGIGNTMNLALKAAEKPRLVFFAYLCSGAVTFLLGMPLVIHFGLQGAVYGLLLSASGYTISLAVGFVATTYDESNTQLAT